MIVWPEVISTFFHNFGVLIILKDRKLQKNHFGVTFGQINDRCSVFHLKNFKSVFHILILNTLYVEFYLENWKESSMQGMFLFASFAKSKSHYLLFFTVRTRTAPLCRSNPTINIHKKTICILKTQN